MKRKKMKPFGLWISCLLVVSLTLCACGGEPAGTSENGKEVASAEPITADFAKRDDEMFTDRDFAIAYDESQSVRVNLTDNGATASSDAVDIVGSVVTLTAEATYVVSGSLSDGQLVVDAPENAKLHIVLILEH